MDSRIQLKIKDAGHYGLHAVAAARERAAWPALVGLLDLKEW